MTLFSPADSTASAANLRFCARSANWSTEDKLIRLGYGVYGRAEISPLTKQRMLAADGFGAISRENPVEAHYGRTRLQQDRSTQVPMTPRVRLPSSRISCKVRYRPMELTVE